MAREMSHYADSVAKHSGPDDAAHFCRNASTLAAERVLTDNIRGDVTIMTKGIRVIWHDNDGNIDEIEYFYGIDIDQLDHVPEFTKVPACWPRYRGGTWVVYTVNARCERNRNRPGEVRLFVTYDPANNPELAEEWHGDIYWGENTIILEQGSQQGRCEWLRDGAADFEEVAWEAFDCGYETCARPRHTYRGSRREAQFRTIILACDDHRCVLTGETTTKALEAAHLIPAANGENDVPCNGITLRAGLHRLFDAGLFTFDPDGQVVRIAQDLSATYRRLLRNRRLPPSTLERVRATLASPPFPNRPNAE